MATAGDKLVAALQAIDWPGNVAAFLADPTVKDRLAACNLRLAVWSRQLEEADAKNPALTFVREMQAAGQNVTALASLGLYKAAAAAARTVLETALYYSYFRTHHEELATLLRVPSFYVDKKEILDYHKLHTPAFKDNQAALGLLSRLEDVYAALSAIVHGQIPGVWTIPLKETAHSEKISKELADRFCEAEEVVHRLFLASAAQVFWGDFSNTSKTFLLKGLDAELRASLVLDKA